MKSLLFTLVLLFSVGSLACPSLGGSYTCTADDGETWQENVFQFTNGEGIEEYYFEDTTMVMDGKTRTETSPDGGIISTTSYCKNSSTISFEVHFSWPNDNFSANTKGTITEGFNSDFTVNMMSLVSENGKSSKEFNTTTCKKN